MVMFMIKGELYKLLRSKSVKVLFILLLVLNSFQIIYVNYQNIYGDINTGKRKILKIIEGPISQQKYDWLVNYHNTMLEQVNNGNYNTKNKSKNTFSGYVFGDEQISNNLLEDYEYTINYHSSIKNKITILDENIKKTQNSKWKKENLLVYAKNEKEHRQQKIEEEPYQQIDLSSFIDTGKNHVPDFGTNEG